MAFCRQCGADLNGSKFCSNCGAAADADVAPHSIPANADPRQRSLADMEHMINYFGKKSAQYDEFDTVSAEVEERTQKSYGGWIGAAVISLIIALISKGIFFYILIVPFIAAFVLLKKSNNDKLAIATARRNELDKELNEYYVGYGYCAVGREYTKPALLNILNEYIRGGRATTPGDAINLYMADLDKQRAEQQMQELIEQNKQLNKEMKKTRRYAAASFWLKK